MPTSTLSWVAAFSANDNSKKHNLRLKSLPPLPTNLPTNANHMQISYILLTKLMQSITTSPARWWVFLLNLGSCLKPHTLLIYLPIYHWCPWWDQRQWRIRNSTWPTHSNQRIRFERFQVSRDKQASCCTLQVLCVWGCLSSPRCANWRGKIRHWDIPENTAAGACQQSRVSWAWAARRRPVHLCCNSCEVLDPAWFIHSWRADWDA